jgi:hypothetical protein
MSFFVLLLSFESIGKIKKPAGENRRALSSLEKLGALQMSPLRHVMHVMMGDMCNQHLNAHTNG